MDRRETGSITGRSSSPKEFAVFAKLRELRKQIAQEEAVPDLHGIYQRATGPDGPGRATTKSDLEKIDGRGRCPDREVRRRDSSSCSTGNGRGKGPEPMRRAGHLFDQIADRENLRMAAYKALRGKRSKEDACAFVANLDESLSAMRTGLIRGDIRAGRVPPVHDLRPEGAADHGPVLSRAGAAPRDHERVRAGVRAVPDRRHVRLPPWQGPDRGASQRARHFARRYAFFLKLDIRKYFDSISHENCCARLARKFKDRRLLDLFDRIIASYESAPGRGVPIGSLTSQHFANFYLGWFDRFVKERLRCRRLRAVHGRLRRLGRGSRLRSRPS